MNLNVFGIRIGLSKGPMKSSPASDLKGRRQLGSLAIALSVTVMGLVAAPLSAGAANAAQATITTAAQPVKSVTLSTTALTYGGCAGGNSDPTHMGFPNAVCTTASYTVTNGSAAAQITDQGSDAVPSSAGPNHWTLCAQNPGGQAPAPTCPGNPANPGPDQWVEVFNASTNELSNNQQCDLHFGARTGNTCTSAAPGASQSEALRLEGPASSTDTSPTFTTTITYTAN